MSPGPERDAVQTQISILLQKLEDLNCPTVKPSITVLSPNGGEKFIQNTPNNVVLISWVTSGNGRIGIKLVDEYGNFSGWILNDEYLGTGVGDRTWEHWEPEFVFHYNPKVSVPVKPGNYKIIVGILNPDPSSFCGSATKYPCEFIVSDSSDAPFSIVSGNISLGDVRFIGSSISGNAATADFVVDINRYPPNETTIPTTGYRGYYELVASYKLVGSGYVPYNVVLDRFYKTETYPQTSNVTLTSNLTPGESYVADFTCRNRYGEAIRTTSTFWIR